MAGYFVAACFVKVPVVDDFPEAACYPGVACFPGVVFAGGVVVPALVHWVFARVAADHFPFEHLDGAFAVVVAVASCDGHSYQGCVDLSVQPHLQILVQALLLLNWSHPLLPVHRE